MPAERSLRHGQGLMPGHEDHARALRGHDILEADDLAQDCELNFGQYADGYSTLHWRSGMAHSRGDDGCGARHHSSCVTLRLRFNLPQPGVSIIRAAPQDAQPFKATCLVRQGPIWRSKSSIARRGVINFVQLSSVNRRRVTILWLGPRNTPTQERYVLNDQEGLMKKTKKRRETRSGRSTALDCWPALRSFARPLLDAALSLAD
jgi:hypothetical protein